MGLFGSTPRWREQTCPECGDLFAEKHDDFKFNDIYYCSGFCVNEAFHQRQLEEVNILVNQGMNEDDAWAELNRRAIEAARKRLG